MRLLAVSLEQGTGDGTVVFYDPARSVEVGRMTLQERVSALAVIGFDDVDAFELQLSSSSEGELKPATREEQDAVETSIKFEVKVRANFHLSRAPPC